MHRILIYTSPGLGHLYPALGVAEELRARGHDVFIICLSDRVDTVREKGFQARAMDPRVEHQIMDDFEATNPIDAVKRAVGTFSKRAPFEVDDLLSGIKEFKPDALVIDTNSFGARMAAESSGLPWACFQPFLTPLPAPGVPPFGPGLKRKTGRIGRLRDRVVARLVTATLEKLTLNAVNPVRYDLGLAPLANYDAFHTAPPRTLYFTTAEFDYPRSEWPKSFVMCGPMHDAANKDVPDWLVNEQRDIVLVTCSTELQADRAIIDTALEALADSEFLVVATSAAHDPMSFDIPPNARVERFAPHDPLLDRATAVICHGGMGITQKALSKGIPVCVVPFGRDQLEVARRVEHAAAGIYLPPGRLGPRDLRQAVLDARQCRTGARKIAESFQRAGGAARAADSVLDLLGRREHIVLDACA